MNIKTIIEQAAAFEQSLPEFPGGLEIKGKTIASYLDSTLLKPEATTEQVRELCEDARNHKFAAVCINPIFVSRVQRFLKGSEVKNCTVIGFPLGAIPTSFKVDEAIHLVKEGAEEIDMVIAIGMLKERQYEYVYSEIGQIAAAAHAHNAHCKVILETGLLSQQEKIISCLLSKAAEADFVKTSTGMIAGGATVEDVKLMRCVVGKEMGVKASGGIRTLVDAQAMIKNGATRLGTSAAVKILTEATQNGG